MSPSEPLIRNISDTALWAAVYRAYETEREDALFQDPYARRLAGERGERIADSIALVVAQGSRCGKQHQEGRLDSPRQLVAQGPEPRRDTCVGVGILLGQPS